MATYTKGRKIQLSKNFKSNEFDCKGKGCCAVTKIDRDLIILLQQIRNHFNAPVIINSGYRCKAHNKAVGGAAVSQHLKGKAADIVVKGVAANKVARYCDEIGVKGLGYYLTFTHVDTRAHKARWNG